MSKRTPVFALVRCVICTEMLAIYEELTHGETDDTRKMWADAGKVRGFIDQPRLKNHRMFLIAQIQQFRDAREQRGKPS